MVSNKVRCASLSMFLCCPLGWAAEVTVVVKEKGSGVAVEGATVVLNQGDDYDTSDGAGQVIFSDVESPSTIKVLAAGYETHHHSLPLERSNVTVYLMPLTVIDAGLEVTAERISEQASKYNLVAGELVGTAGSQGDPLKALTALPGIVAAADGSAQVYMRGSGVDDNIVWVNRAPVGYLYHFGGFQSTIHPALVEDINIFPAGFPVEYGDALGGVIDVQLRSPRRDRMHYLFDVSTIASSFLVEGPAGLDGENSFLVAGRRSYIDFLFSPDEFTDLVENDDNGTPDQIILVPRFYDAQAMYRHTLQSGYVDFYYFAAADEQARELIGSALSDPQLAGELRSRTEYQTLGMTWWQSWSSRLNHVMTLAYYQDEDSFRLGQDENGEPFFVDTEANTLYWQPELNWGYGGDDVLTVGVAASYTEEPVDLFISRPPDENDIDFDFTSQQKHRLNKTLYLTSYAPYVKHRVQWTDRWASIVGLRYTDVSLSGGFHAREWSPRLTLEYSLSDKTLLTATWGRYVQIPQGAQILDQFGNPGLDITEAEHRILGIRHKLSDLYSLQAEIYHKPMTNLVVSIDDNPPPDNYANEGSGEAYGFDLFLKREARDRKKGWLSLSYAKSRRRNKLTGVERDFSGDQPFTMTLVWGQPLGGRQSKWDWSVKAEVRSGLPYTEVIGRHREDPADPESRWIPEFGEHNGARTSTYRRVDLRVSRRVLFNRWTMTFYLDLQNVTFARNVVGFDYGDEYENIENPTEVIGLPFFPFFGVEADF